VRATVLESVFPTDTNSRGTLFGGTLLAWMDKAAAYAAVRRARNPVVTAAIESVSFTVPIHQGEMVVLDAEVEHVGRTSLRVRVDVYREDPTLGTRELCTVGHFSMVAIGPDGRPTPVGPAPPNGGVPE
jgi:acyl-CoA hydrolase